MTTLARPGAAGNPDAPTRSTAPAPAPALHDTVALRLAGAEQRYTRQRRVLVDTLARAGRPLTIPEIVALAPDLPQSSVYRNVTNLLDAGVLRRVSGADDHGRIELAEELSGHHHHLICTNCGTVEDFDAFPELERAVEEATRRAAHLYGYAITEHRLELFGSCPACTATHDR